MSGRASSWQFIWIRNRQVDFLPDVQPDVQLDDFYLENPQVIVLHRCESRVLAPPEHRHTHARAWNIRNLTQEVEYGQRLHCDWKCNTECKSTFMRVTTVNLSLFLIKINSNLSQPVGGICTRTPIKIIMTTRALTGWRISKERTHFGNWQGYFSHMSGHYVRWWRKCSADRSALLNP